MEKINLKDLSEADLLLIRSQADRLLGITPDRALDFLSLSESEHPEKDAEWHLNDATGKFKHFLRTERDWGGAVDAVWPHIQDEARRMVELVARNRP